MAFPSVKYSNTAEAGDTIEMSMELLDGSTTAGGRHHIPFMWLATTATYRPSQAVAQHGLINGYDGGRELHDWSPGGNNDDAQMIYGNATGENVNELYVPAPSGKRWTFWIGRGGLFGANSATFT